MLKGAGINNDFTKTGRWVRPMVGVLRPLAAQWSWGQAIGPKMWGPMGIPAGQWPPNGRGGRPMGVKNRRKIRPTADHWHVHGGQWSTNGRNIPGQWPTNGQKKPEKNPDKKPGDGLARFGNNPETTNGRAICPMVAEKPGEKNPDNGPSFSGLESFFPFLPPSPDFLRSLRIFQFFLSFPSSWSCISNVVSSSSSS